jgi:dolichol-phosphate mannosyltransferase
VRNTVICLPTYNERDNLEAMLRRLSAMDVRVLVVDDNSPDGTGEIADRLAQELDGVSVLHRERKEGLGPAYLAGFRRALADGAEYVLEMDCDFSHDPDDVPRLLAACEDGADLALGSRYVEGGGTVNWGLGRRVISWGGSFYARLLLGVGIRDLTGGFKCYRRTVLETIELDAVHSKGYAFQIETTYRALRRGFRVVEVPIRFADRTEGHSKMSRAIVLEAVTKVPALRLAALSGRLERAPRRPAPARPGRAGSSDPRT